MAETEIVELEHVQNGKLPALVQVDLGEFGISPNELRLLKAETGKTMEDLLGEAADDADRMQTIAWLQLRRQGHQIKWVDAGDVQVGGQVEAPSDPTRTGISPSSPPSATSGE